MGTRPSPDVRHRWNHLRLLCYMLVCLLMIFALVGAECTDSANTSDDNTSTDDDDDDDDNGQLDDCGFPLVSMPEGCDKCHGFPPATARHPQNNRCYRCHGYTVDDQLNFIDGGKHNNGEVDYAVGCSSCHGWDEGTSPPQNLKGQCTQGLDGVGNHKQMRRNEIVVHRTNCSDCHTVPSQIWQEGHIDGDQKAEVKFANLAVANGTKPVFKNNTCSGVYCHGATLKGGTHKDPVWTDTSGKAGECGACHALTDPNGNADADCHSCHPTTVDESNEILPMGTHVNGTIDIGTEKSGR